MFGIDQRQRHRAMAQFCRRMTDHHRIVPLNLPHLVSLRDGADAHHAERRQFRRAQCAQAGRAIDGDPLGHHLDDFLVPDRWRGFEQSVDQADRGRSFDRGAQHVAAPRRPAQLDTIGQGHHGTAQARPGKDNRMQTHAGSIAACIVPVRDGRS